MAAVPELLHHRGGAVGFGTARRLSSIVTDILGLLLGVVLVTAASVQDSFLSAFGRGRARWYRRSYGPERTSGSVLGA
ncbi:hypothetical protein [Streptomyces sp. NPDC088254]|uniref:hypothetical protein n=1 Tax=Streptomyces sp. NPDC088254 TaxID=3365847 RepID=UPI003814C084